MLASTSTLLIEEYRGDLSVLRDRAGRDPLRERELLQGFAGIGPLGATHVMLEAFLVTRGVRTLALRMDVACANAGILAQRLSEHPNVDRVRYPGFARQADEAPSFMTMNGAMVSFEVRGGADEADRVCRAVRLVRHATSLGGVESSMERRGALRGQAHVPGGLVRLSVGCEDVEDLWSDLDAALSTAGDEGAVS